MICQPDLLEIRHSCYAPMTKDGEEWSFFPIVSFWSLAIFHRSQRFLILSLQFLRVSMVPKIDTAEAIFPHASFLVVYSSSSKFSFQWFTKTSITSLLHKVRVFFSFFFLHIYSLNISSIILSMPHWLVVYNVPSYNILSAKYMCIAIVCSVKSPFFKCWWSYKSMRAWKYCKKIWYSVREYLLYFKYSKIF